MDRPPAPNEETLRFRRLFAILGLLLILIGQYFVFTAPVANDRLPPPTIFLCLAGMIVLAVGAFVRPGKALQERTRRIAIPGPASWMTAAVLFSLLTLVSLELFVKSGQTSYIPVVSTWLASGACFLYGLRGPAPDRARFLAWWRGHRGELLLVGGITLAAAVLRLHQLGVYPRVIDGDEGRIGLIAQTTGFGTYANPFALWENFGALYLQAVNLCIRIFGADPLALRFLPAISGILAVPALYLFARQIAGRRTATLAAVLLAFSHAHINFSRIGSVGYIHSTWLVPLELYLLLAGIEKRKSWMTAAAGVLLAIHFSVYLTSQIILALILVFMLLALAFLRAWFRPVLRQAAAFWAACGLMLLPELFYILRNPQAFLDRLTQNGTFQTGWLAQTMANTGQNAFEVLAGRVAHAFLALNYYPALDFYGSSMPMISLFTAVFFLAGLVIAVLRLRRPGMLLLNGYFWAPTLAVGIFSIPPSADSYRMLIALPPAMIIAGLAIDEVLTALGVGWERARSAYAFLAGGLLLSLAVLNLWTYYGDFVGQCRFGGDLPGRFASYLGSYAESVEPGSRIFLLSDPLYFYGSHDSAVFLSERRTITNVPEPIQDWPAVAGDTVIAPPSRMAELEAWMRTRPGGESHYEFDCANIILLSYQVP